MINIITAMAKNRVIGRDGKLPWRLPPDMKRFKKLTMDHKVVMGRVTWEGIKALPGRDIIVLSQTLGPDALVWGIQIAQDLDECLQLVEGDAFIAGGAQVYELFIPIADRMYITYLHHDRDGDAYFPEFEASDWTTVEAARYDTFSFLTLERANGPATTA